MKDFLLVLFYQAIVAVNTAVILTAIIWLAKRKENQKKTPNPDFTPPPEKKPPTPPTTGSCAVKPKGTCFYKLEVRDGPGNPVVATFSAKSEEELKKQIEKLKAEPIAVYNPEEESVKRYEARTAQLPHYCGNCMAHRQEKFNGEIIHMCMRHKVWLHNQERWDGGCDAWEPSPAICKLYKEWADGFCSSCKYFEPEEPGQKRGIGLCARNDEIKMMGQSCTGYARKGELPKYLERHPMERPEPLGTVAVGERNE